MKIKKFTTEIILYARYALNQYGFGNWIVNKQGQKVDDFREYSGEHKEISFM